MISHVDIIGALVYRTRQALNKVSNGAVNSAFYESIYPEYKYRESMFDNNGNVHLWHFPGTQNEITETIEKIGKDALSAMLCFPCIYNYQCVDETHGLYSDESVQIDYDLAIAALVDSSWTTQERDRIVHRLILEPIYEEFIRQIRLCGWFQVPLGGLSFRRMKVFTTGSSLHSALRTQYGWYFDTIQLTDLRLRLNVLTCENDIDTILSESEKVTDSLTGIINNNSWQKKA